MREKEGPTKLRILLVEDEEHDRALIHRALEKSGISLAVTECQDADEALERLREDPSSFDIVVVDHGLPGMSGLDLCRKLIGDKTPVPLVLLTGGGSEQLAVDALKAGVDDYVAKGSLGYLELLPVVLEDAVRKHNDRVACERVEQALMEAEEKYRTLVENANDAILIIQDETTVYRNPTYQKLIGYSVEETRDLSFRDLIVPEDREQFTGYCYKLSKGYEVPEKFEVGLSTKQGKTVIMEAKPCRIKYRGRPAAMVVMRDITDRRKAERAMLRKEKLKTLGAVAAEVSHEIRNPLVLLGGFARRLKKEHPDSREADIIMKECQRLEKLLDRIKNYLAPVEINLQESAVNDLVAAVVSLFEPQLAAKMIECRLDTDPEISTAYTDRDVLIQIFINIIQNAVEALSDGGTLHIRTFASDETLNVEFSNRALGPKIKDEDLMFLPFDEGGHSIGLPLCYKLLEEMGGHLGFRQEDDLTIVTVSLPRRDPGPSA